MSEKRKPLYSIQELSRLLGISAPKLRGHMGRKENRPPSPVKMKSLVKISTGRFYDKEEFINWFNSLSKEKIK